MPYKVSIYFAKDYASITVKDWLSDSICMDILTDTELKYVAVKKSATFQVLIGQKNNVGEVIIDEAAAGATSIPTSYKIPAELDATGTITFPKPAAVSQSDIGKLTEEIEAIKQRIGP
ncbi:hypothetical protein EFD56_08720 [Rhizobium phaseoli]|uniref:hypothetical protein n=1 Tax=Rhizobium phaseoli TaxID=396 RepID=UPI000F882C6E|nr:hypothetical protein [Rhizobium phaseoli]RUM20245.1 hypothetical protein EFD56_08720 [Rhizobium phaseoli]